jgi:UDP-3-O-acyl-N-acetylglucosamine deacetylase
MNSISPEYKLGKTIFGSSDAIAKSYEIFAKQKIDEVRLLQNGVSGYSSFRTTLKGESSAVGVGTFEGSSKQTITFAPSKKPGWWIRRMDQPQQLDTLIDISNLWTSAQNLVMRSGSPHNYLRMVEHIVALKLGLGLDDVLIKVNSGDPPLFDQSSVPLIEAVDSAQMAEKDEKVSFVTVKEPVAFGGQRGDFLLFIPAEKGDTTLRIDCAIKWNTVIGEQRVLFDVSPDVFRYAAFARTNATYKQYVLAKTVGKFFAATRNWGYNKKNILIHGKKGFFNEPRFPVNGKFLEPVWHRATLDLMAALSLTGADRFAGTVVSYRAGHTLDCDAIRALYRNDLLCSV